MQFQSAINPAKPVIDKTKPRRSTVFDDGDVPPTSQAKLWVEHRVRAANIMDRQRLVQFDSLFLQLLYDDTLLDFTHARPGPAHSPKWPNLRMRVATRR
jgi:hypothetical protein